MHKRAKVWAKDHLAATQWTTRFRSRAPRKKERKITLSKGHRAAGAASVSWWRRLLGLSEGGYTRNLLERIPFFRRGRRGPSRVVRPNTMAGAGVQTHAPQSFPDNKIHTHKYTALTFIPLNLYEQFKRLANLWFLIVAILHLIPEISSLNPAASLIPLIFVLGVTAIKEAVEDVKRRVQDTKLNNSKVKVYSPATGGFISARWKDVHVGDIIKLRNGDQVPADIFLLNSSDADGLCYIETANLDGETNLKIRQALSETIEALEDEESIAYFQGVVECEHPNAELYSFEGTLRMDYDADPVPINLEQTLWRGCALRNTEWIYGMVINTGMDTKIMKNARKPPSKRSTLEKDMNRSIFTVLILGVLLALIAAVFNGIWTSDKGFDHWYLSLRSIHSSAFIHGLSSFGSWLILLNIIIPISLYVYMELIKVVMAFYINSDLTMYHEETNTPARANTSNLAEELGQIEYVFSDKTGTLTSNQMNFMRCSVRGRLYGYPPDRIFEEDGSQPDQVFIYDDPDLQKAIRGDKYESEESRDTHLFFRSLALCHSVVIERHGPEPEQDQDQNDDGTHQEVDQAELDLKSEARIEYQAASPDESALVIAAQKLSFELYDRDKESIYVRVQGVEERWELLNILEFNSDRKRMSVILRDPTTGLVRLFCKGADNVIFERLAPGQEELKNATFDHLATFGSEGLRTLVFATRVIPSDEYDAWNERYRQAALKIYGREEAMDAVAEEIEKDMELLGATAIEDKLQDGVPQAISTLMAAGLKMWVLTGDKMETAINIGFSCSLLSQDMKTLVLSSEELEEAEGEESESCPSVVSPQTAIQALDRHFQRHFPGQVEPWSQTKIDEFLFSLSAGTQGKAPGMQERELQELHSNINNRGVEVDQTDDDQVNLDEEESPEPREYALVIDGKALSQYLPSSGAYNELSARFLELAMRCKAVICCRVSPLQKSLVVNLVKQGLKATTLSIGDGANDVPMIQAANVGVGISGKEGRQAVMAADYAIAQFRFLVPLLLVHGQWSYRRMCKLVLYSFWKNMLFAITNICFGFYSAFSAQTLYDSWVVSFYNILFTGLPIFLVAAFDQPISRRQIMDYPPLYRNGIRHQSFSPFKYWQWQAWAVVQAIIISMFSVAAFRNDILLGNGQTLDAFALGLEIMTAVILTVNVKIFLVTNTWTVWNHLAVWGSVAAWFLFIILYSPIPTSHLLGPNLIAWVTFKAMSSAFYWLGAILITACAILPDLVYCYLRRTYLPENYHVIQEMHLLNEEDQRKMRRRERAKRMRRKLTSLVKRRRVTYTGFAFAQAPGVRDVMLTLGLAPVPTEKKEERKQQQNQHDVSEDQDEDQSPVHDETTRRGAREEEAYHDDLTAEHNDYY